MSSLLDGTSKTSSMHQAEGFQDNHTPEKTTRIKEPEAANETRTPVDEKLSSVDVREKTLLVQQPVEDEQLSPSVIKGALSTEQPSNDEELPLIPVIRMASTTSGALSTEQPSNTGSFLAKSLAQEPAPNPLSEPPVGSLLEQPLADLSEACDLLREILVPPEERIADVPEVVGETLSATVVRCEDAAVPLPWRSPNTVSTQKLATDQEIAAITRALHLIMSLRGFVDCVKSVNIPQLLEWNIMGLQPLGTWYEARRDSICEELHMSSTILCNTLRLPFKIPDSRLPEMPLRHYMDAIFPKERFDYNSLTFEEMRTCLLASELHIGLSDKPGRDQLKNVLLSMPFWYLVQSWNANWQDPDPGIFMGIRSKEAKDALSKDVPVDDSIMAMVIEYHRLHVRELKLQYKDKAVDLDDILEKRIFLEAGKLNEERFAELEKILQDLWGCSKSIRILLAKRQRPDIHPGIFDELAQHREDAKKCSILGNVMKQGEQWGGRSASVYHMY